MASPQCIVTGASGAPCPRIVDAAAPLAVCEQHLAVANEWAERTLPLDDLLEAPCAACGSRLGARYPSGWLCAVCEWRVGDVVDPELPLIRVDVVYYLRFEDRIKIGTTANPRQRLSRLWHHEVLAFELGDRLRERARHIQFADCRLGRSEWFARHPSLESHIEDLAAGIDDPWHRYARWRSDSLARQL